MDFFNEGGRLMNKVFNLQSEDDEEQKMEDMIISALETILKYGCRSLTCAECPIDQTDDNQAKICEAINNLSKCPCPYYKNYKKESLEAITILLKEGCGNISCCDCPIDEIKHSELCDAIEFKNAKYHISEFNESYGKGK